MWKTIFACVALIGVGLLWACPGITTQNRNPMRSASSTTRVTGLQSSALPVTQMQNQASLPQPMSMPVVKNKSIATANPSRFSGHSTGIPDHEWVLVTESDGLLFGDFVEPIELELKFEYGTARIPLADIVSFSRVQAEEKKETSTGIQVPDASPTPLLDIARSKSVSGQNESKPDDDDSGTNATTTGTEGPADNLIVVATRSGNILVGRCDLADFHLRTRWGTMTVESSRVNTICCKSCGLNCLAQSTSGEGWMLMPLKTNRTLHVVDGTMMKSTFTTRQRVWLRSWNTSNNLSGATRID